MKHILIPTDFSELAWNALVYGLELFNKIECTFYLLHVNPVPVYSGAETSVKGASEKFQKIILKDSKVSLKKLLGRIQKMHENDNHSFITLALYDTFSDAIKRETKNKKIDLIIMGTKGATGAKEILFGSNTIHVITKATCPVIAIPENFDYEAPNEILFPTDYEIEFQKENLHLLLNVAKLHLSRINVIHVRAGYTLTKTQEMHKNQLKKLLGDFSLFHDLPDNGIIDAVNEFQSKTKINLLVMVQNKHSFLEKLFIEPVIKKLGFHSTVPFMVIPQA
ncbi:universal stress protein [Maribacter sp. ACAM166]|uniref:universal stress protein n=1 Tax=Maribacter sp. ACAM166 TaxID=2508996 RepID=UPI0010FD819F|nr:universal stress protein [Maribacter sp. ACAM166]TLP79812.1 universal stress protein [Maribacter sp. ACAM166]